MHDLKKQVKDAALLKMRYEHLNKGDNPLNEHFLMYPATINGRTHNPESNLKYHVTLRSLGEIPPHIPTLDSRMKDVKGTPPKEFGLVPHKFIRPDGTPVHVLRLTPKTPEMHQAHEAMTQHYGPDKFAEYVPHITVEKELWDQVHKNYPNHQLNIQIHPLELWHGGDVLWQKHPPEFKIAKAEGDSDQTPPTNHPVLNKEPHFIFSANNPLYPDKADRTLTPEKVREELHNSGERFEEVNGHYGSPEKSIIVFHPKNIEKLHTLASRLGQESGIYSNGNVHEMRYYHGDDKGKIIPGRGTQFFNEKPSDFYTELNVNNKPVFFRHNLDFTQAQTSPRQHPHSYDWQDNEVGAQPDPNSLPNQVKKMDTTSDQDMSTLDVLRYQDEARENIAGKKKLHKAHPHIQAHGPAQNEQAGGNASGQFHDIMGQYGTVNPGTKTNLKFYKDIQHHEPSVDQHLMGQGYQTYFAGGKHGIPDLKNKNYNTKHLMVYDPSPASGGDFGDEAYTRTWRKIHEKAHADTYPQINKIYGEGRRLGKLGVRSPREMKRAIHWEWLAAHHQRDLMGQMGYKIPDTDFHKELNTVMGDAVHRAITGKFTDPNDMGFHPHGHKVSLENAMQMVDQHAKALGLRHDDDTFLKQKQEGLRMSEYSVNPKLAKIETARKIKDLTTGDTLPENCAIIDSEGLEKGMLKTGLNFVTALSMLGVPTNLAHRSVQDAVPIQQKKVEFPDLDAIKFIESTNGKNTAHRRITSGLNAGTSAIGSYGLMPIMVSEIVQKNPAIAAEHPDLQDLDPVKDEAKMRKIVTERPGLENKLAHAHWSRLMNKFNGEPNKAAYAWMYGITGTMNATPHQIKSDPYVQKFNKAKKLKSFADKTEKASFSTLGNEDTLQPPHKAIKMSNHDVLYNSSNPWKPQK